MNTTNDTSDPVYRLAPRHEEQAALTTAFEHLESLRSKSEKQHGGGIRVVAISTGRGQAAEQIARRFDGTQVLLWYIDLFHQQRAMQHCRISASACNQVSESTSTTKAVDPPSNLDVRCMADLPNESFDVAIVPTHHQGEQELTRDYLQQAYDRLEIGGTLIASVDNPKDRWLHDQLKLYEKSVRVREHPEARAYLVEKTKPLKKLKDFSCDLAFRDCDELIYLTTRPGVFSHRQLDNGARQLLDAVDVFPEARLIDIGCGSGSVALGLAMRDPTARVHAVDSNSRAIWCVEHGAQRNKLTNVTTELNATGEYINPGNFDMALANPPYFGDFQIAEKMVLAAHRSLREGGRLVLVTKQPVWYEENLPRWFQDCEVFASARYHIASGVK
ncbi:MAG: class I SAM-dependent methyltransferase [Pirellula sp.]